jgi:hypothetical protein
MKRPFTNEEQTALIEKLRATFERHELRMLPQIFEVWFEEHSYELHDFYDTTEVYNMGIDWPTFLAYNFDLCLWESDETLNQMTEARAEELRKLKDDNHTEPFEGNHPTDLPY